MAAGLRTSGAPINLTASGVVSKAGGQLLGFYVNSTSSGTVVLRSGATSGASAVTGTITPSAGWNPAPFDFPNGCYATIANTLDVTFSFAAG